GALVLCLSPRFVQLDRMVTMDGLLCLWVVVAWATAHTALDAVRFRANWWLASALACGLGLLTKGPVAVVLVLFPLIAHRWLQPRSMRVQWRWLTAYVAGAIGVAAPWSLVMAIQDAGFLGHFFWFHHWQRFVEPFDHVEPVWFYLPVLFLGMLPWTVMVPSLIAHLVRRPDTGPATGL